MKSKILKTSLMVVFFSMLLLTHFKLWLFLLERNGFHVLLWPSLIMSRFGLSYSFLAMTPCFWAIWHFRKRFTLLNSAISITVYVLLGFLYAFVLPVPSPALPEWHLSSRYSVFNAQETQDFLDGYHAGYRKGLSHDLSMACFREPSESYATGLLQGISMGMAEYERVFPGVTTSPYRAFLAAASEGTQPPRSQNR